MASLMDKGFMFDEVRRYIFNTAHMKNLGEVINFISTRTNCHENILKTGVYYHRQLKIIPKPHVVDIDYNEGTMVSRGQEYFVEMVASYSMKNLKDYLLSNLKIDKVNFFDKRVNGILVDSVKRYGLELTLFMIDVATEFAQENEIKEFPLEKLTNYYDKAKARYNIAVNNCNSNGGNIICPRKRF